MYQLLININSTRGNAMIDEKMAFKDYVEQDVMLEKKKRKKKKSKRTKRRGAVADSWYSSGAPAGSSGMDGGGVGESLLAEIFSGMGPACTGQTVNTAVAMNQNNWVDDEGNSPDEEGLSTLPREEEPEVNLVDTARQLFQQLVHHPDSNRASILNAFIKDVGVTQSTAVSYYTRFMDEFGLTDDDVGQPHPEGGQGAGMGDVEGGSQTPYGEPEPLPDDQELEEPEDSNRAGLIRTVDNAHLIFKRQAENGTFEELWIYNIHSDTNDELEVRRAILSGTDIPVKKTKSPDGVQSYTSTTMGNAQMLKISGLPN